MYLFCCQNSKLELILWSFPCNIIQISLIFSCKYNFSIPLIKCATILRNASEQTISSYSVEFIVSGFKAVISAVNLSICLHLCVYKLV